MRMGRALVASVLVDGEDALHATRGAAEGLLHGVADHALGEARLEAGESLRRPVIDGENEAEVDGPLETAGVLDQGLPDRPFVTAEGAIARADAVQLASAAVRQALLAMGDVADL